MSAEQPAHAAEHAHPGAQQYITIAAILSFVTLVEVAVYYIEALRPVLLPVLVVLSAGKFSLVVMFYMHLKFDNRLFSGMFLFGLATALFTAIAFIFLFHLLQPRFVAGTLA